VLDRRLLADLSVMKDSRADGQIDSLPRSAERLTYKERWIAWLERPMPLSQMIISWILAGALFMGLVLVLGGPSEGDAAESVYSTWAIAYGHWSCAYPPASKFIFPDIASPFALVAPLYPLLTGALAALFRIGDASPFPSTAALGPHCSTAFTAMYKWSGRSSAILPTVRLSYLTWLVLMAGIVAILRASGRGRRGWEAMTILLAAVSPPVLMCLITFFHPQDLVAMGLVLGGIACALRGRWAWTGALLGLSFTTQQFALLAIAALFVLAPRQARWRIGLAAAGAWALVSLPFIVLTSGRALKEALLGSSRVGYVHRSTGGTVLWEINPHGVALFFLSRVMPVVLAAALAWWARRRLGPRALEPVVLTSVVAVSFCFRLIFEVNLFGYYFMAIAVLLIILDVLRGQLRGLTWAWVALVTLAFNPIPWGYHSNATSWGYPLFKALPFIFAGAVGLLLVANAVRRRYLWYLGAWLVLVVLTCFPALWGHPPGIPVMPNWFWQLVLVPIATAMAARPLLVAVGHRAPDHVALGNAIVNG
jgi:Glycosyltransferase family 87